jgi:hypothetical protein
MYRACWSHSPWPLNRTAFMGDSAAFQAPWRGSRESARRSAPGIFINFLSVDAERTSIVKRPRIYRVKRVLASEVNTGDKIRVEFTGLSDDTGERRAMSSFRTISASARTAWIASGTASPRLRCRQPAGANHSRGRPGRGKPDRGTRRADQTPEAWERFCGDLDFVTRSAAGVDNGIS